jgi:lambda repressor-like predicted transcriptional regulator
MGAVNDEADELAALRQAFPGYRFRRRHFRGVPCYLAEARRPRDAPPGVSSGGAPAAEVPLVAARSLAVLADMLAVAAGRPVRLRPAAVAAAYRDRRMSMQQCAAMFGVSRTTIMKFLATEGVEPRRPGRVLDESALAADYRDGLSLRECAARFGVSERSVAAVLERQGVPRRAVGRPPRRTAPGSGPGS